MKRRRNIFAPAAVAVAATLAPAASAMPADPGFDTSRPAQLVAVEGGVVIDPILSTGDIVGDYQMSGIPDGLGAYKSRRHTIKVLMNHELDGSAPAGVGARISKVTLDRKTRSVRSAQYVLDGSEGFLRLCSSSLARIKGKPWYFTGEETTDDGGLTSDPADGLGRGGSSIALNARTGNWFETRHFGLFAHENVVPVKRSSGAMILSPEDGDPGANESQLWAYLAPTFSDAIAGYGQLYVWKSDDEGDGNPSTNDIAKGETLSGRFVPVSQTENANAVALETAAQSKNAFDFVRAEDATVAAKGTIYFDDTGRLGSETVRGRLYRLNLDRRNPLRASITVLLDGDAGDDIVNPDNLGSSAHSVVIQEDRNSEHRGPLGTVAGRPDDPGYGRVLVYDIDSGLIRVVARPATPATLRPGEWESSGVINAEDLLGNHWWLLDIQAHSQTAPQPGPSLAPNSSAGEDGQLLAVKIPGS